jgi:hypothetical protein
MYLNTRARVRTDAGGENIFRFLCCRIRRKVPGGSMRTMKIGPTIPGKRADAGRWRLSGLARPPSDGRIPSAWRGDEIGKHSGLKIRRLTACRFKSGPRYQRPNHLIKTLGVKRKFAGTRCVVFRQFLVRTAFHCVSVQPRSWGYCAPSRISHAGRSHFVNETRAA